MKILGIIPARYDSSRFPGKPLADIDGKTMIQRVYEQCLKAKSLTNVIVATDDVRIYDEVIKFGGEAIMTSGSHLNGTSRCAEVAQHYSLTNDYFDYIINIQGDEPFIHPEQIDELAILFEDNAAQIITQVIKENDLSLLENPNIVKAFFDKDKFAVDFKRIIEQSIFLSDNYYRHIGIYGFKIEVIKEITNLAPTQNELEYQLEQFRWLDNGYRIKVGITQYKSLSIDTKEDLEKAMIQIHLK